MQAAQYPRYTEHKKIHDDLVVSVKNLRNVLETEGPTDNFMDMLDKQVTEWLYGHIKGDDQAFAEYKNIRSNQCGC